MSDAKRILIVEDDADVRAALVEVFASEGYLVSSAKNGLEALNYLKKGGEAAAIILDLMMPVMSGYEFRREQQKDPALARIPVMIMTAGRINGVEELGVDRYYKKPLEIGELLGELRRLVA